MPTELYTNVTIDGAEYAIKKFTAKTGLKMARLILSKAAPIIPMIDDEDKSSLDKGQKGSNDIYKLVGSVLETLSDDDLDNVVDKCLRVCYAKLPAGLQPIIDETGHYGIPDIEYDMALCLKLCFEAIKWGASDFFDGKSSLSRLLAK